jgi:hypothetical protein
MLFLSTLRSDSHRNSELLIQRSLLLLLPHYHCVVDHADLFHHYSCQQSSALSLLSLFKYSLQCLLIMPIYYILYVLMPSSLLYLPSMTSIHCLLNICQHNPLRNTMEPHNIVDENSSYVRCLIRRTPRNKMSTLHQSVDYHKNRVVSHYC